MGSHQAKRPVHATPATLSSERIRKVGDDMTAECQLRIPHLRVRDRRGEWVVPADVGPVRAEQRVIIRQSRSCFRQPCESCAQHRLCRSVLRDNFTPSPQGSNHTLKFISTVSLLLHHRLHCSIVPSKKKHHVFFTHTTNVLASHSLTSQGLYCTCLRAIFSLYEKKIT